MTQQLAHRLTFAILLICQLTICLGKEIPDANDSSKYLDAVREFADNVLKYGRDTYGPKHTPLFVDGLNIHTHEPVKWISPKGDYATATETEEWIVSNFANQQTLVRTLDGLSTITGDPKYRKSAMQAIEYTFRHLRSTNGLIYWGHVAAYDASSDKVWGNAHCLKLDYPHYELMWNVDPNETKKFIEAYWSAHVNEWSNLDFNRVTRIGRYLEEPWNHEYKGGPTFFTSKHGGGGFFTTGTSLVQAGTTLCRLSGEEQPLVWSKRLIQQYIKTRHPKTGISAFVYNLPPGSSRISLHGEDFKEHFVDRYTTLFPLLPFEEGRGLYHPQNQQALPWISLFLVGDILGENGSEFTQWTLEELTAWGKNAYRKEDNSFIPILTDGTSIEGYVSKESSRDAPRGSVAKPLFADSTLFWAYSMAYRTTGNEFAWQMARDIVHGNNFGDIGKVSTQKPSLRVDTDSADVFSLLGFLELFRKTGNPDFLEMAQRIGDNILDKQFYKGFFVPTKKHIYTRFDCFEPLALLRLVAATENKSESVPEVWPSSPLFVPAYRYKEEGVDRRIIYTLTESTEPPLSLQEAAAIGDLDLVRSLLDKGVGVDSWDDSLKKTALQRAAMSGHKDVIQLLLGKGALIDGQAAGGTALYYAAENGHKEIAELLIAKGADVNAKNNFKQIPLQAAFLRGHKDMAELLISKGSDVNISSRGQPLLHILVEDGHSDMIELLIDNGADVNAKDDRGFTALHLTARSGQKDIVELLITKGADVYAKNNRGITPLVLARRRGFTEIAELLRKHGAKE